jgi:hypothetical protein
MIAAGSNMIDVLLHLLSKGADIDNVAISGHCLATDLREFSEPVQDIIKLQIRFTNGPIQYQSDGYRNSEKIHRTARGEMVRSKSEVIIANALSYFNCDYEYESPFSYDEGKQLIPDFSILKKNGFIIWEHFGMLDNVNYRNRWLEKLETYEKLGFKRNINLIVTSEDKSTPIDSYEIHQIAKKLSEL